MLEKGMMRVGEYSYVKRFSTITLRQNALLGEREMVKKKKKKNVSTYTSVFV
jgi:hypothetical protein